PPCPPAPPGPPAPPPGQAGPPLHPGWPKAQPIPPAPIGAIGPPGGAGPSTTTWWRGGFLDPTKGLLDPNPSPGGAPPRTRPPSVCMGILPPTTEPGLPRGKRARRSGNMATNRPGDRRVRPGRRPDGDGSPVVVGRPPPTLRPTTPSDMIGHPFPDP